MEEKRVLERNLVEVRKEWMKVKEEMVHVKQRGEHLRETLRMLVELDYVDEYVRYLMALSDELL
ncbi:unnamed protein product [Musa banksii]